MQLPLTLRPKPSSGLATALVVAHGLVFVGLWQSGLPPFAVIGVAVILVASLAFHVRAHVLRPRVVALMPKATGSLDVELLDGRIMEASILASTTVFPWLVVLRLRVDNKISALVFPLDALGTQQHRQLRLWLRWKLQQD